MMLHSQFQDQDAVTAGHTLSPYSSYKTHETITVTEPLIAKLTWLNTSHSGWRNLERTYICGGQSRTGQDVSECRERRATSHPVQSQPGHPLHPTTHYPTHLTTRSLTHRYQYHVFCSLTNLLDFLPLLYCTYFIVRDTYLRLLRLLQCLLNHLNNRTQHAKRASEADIQLQLHSMLIN